VSRIIAADEAGIALAARTLRDGGLVAFPTETVYGLGAAALDPHAVRRIFEMKGRPSDHPVIVHLPLDATLEAWTTPVPNLARQAAEAFWPGPLTLVLHRSETVPDAVTGGQATVALRMPDHPVAQALLQAYRGAIAAPSANRFGRISPTRAEHVASEFHEDDLLILEGGASRIGLESTILDLSRDVPTLLRPGAVTHAMLETALGRPVTVAGAQADAPRAPGRLESHYAPRAPTRLASANELSTPTCVEPGGALLLRDAMPPVPSDVTTLRLPSDPEGYAHGLYDALRSLDAEQPSEIVIERPPTDPAWVAILDRLARASHPGGSSRTREQSATLPTASRDAKEEP